MFGSMSLLTTLATGGVATGASALRFKFVPKGSVGIRLRWNNVVLDKQGKPKLIQPGWAWVMPGRDKIHIVPLMPQPLELGTQEVLTSDRHFFALTTAIKYKIVDPVKAVYAVHDLNHMIKLSAEAELQSLLSEKSLDELQKVRDINTELLGAMKQFEADWGVEFISYSVIGKKPSTHSAEVIALGPKAIAMGEAANHLKGHNIGLIAALSGGRVIIPARDDSSTEAEGQKTAAVLSIVPPFGETLS